VSAALVSTAKVIRCIQCPVVVVVAAAAADDEDDTVIHTWS